MPDRRSISITSFIAVPAVITLGITILRLVGELQHWLPRFFNTAPGGGGALVGISWLPIIFGPYFAVKLAGAGEGTPSTGKVVLAASTPARWAAPPAPAMMHARPRSRAVSA